MEIIKTTLRVIQKVLRQKNYQIIAGLSALIFGYANLWLMGQVTTWDEFFRMTAEGEFGSWSILYTSLFIVIGIATVLLFGVSAALLVWQWKHSKVGRYESASADGIGVVASLLGAGCPVCGAFLLNLMGIVGGIGVLPLKGLEFKILSFGLIVAGIIFSAHRVKSSVDAHCSSCEIKPTDRKLSPEIIQKIITYFVMVVLVVNHLAIGQTARSMGVIKKGASINIASFFKAAPAAAYTIYSTKVNPDGKTTTIAQWPTISEVPAEPHTGDTVADARAVMVPTGTPFYAPEGISFDDAVGALDAWGKYENSIQLSGELKTRWDKIVGTMTCDYCCGSPTRVTIINNCGCAHAKAFRSISKYLLQNYGDKYSDEQIIGELQRWKGAWYPRGVIEDYLLATGRGDVIGHKTHGGAGADGRHGF